MATYRQLIKKGEEVLKGTESYNEVRLLMLELCREEDIDLYLLQDEEAIPAIESRFLDGLKRLKNDEPLSYILGYSWFYGYKIIVGPDVLIPRNETEELIGYVLAAIDEYFNDKKLTVFDVGTGSGAIAIALKAEEPTLNVYASDISYEAYKLAVANAKLNYTEISFLIGDMLEPFIDEGLQCDVLICNPPYIPENEIIQRSVKEYEPHLALFGGADGLKYYREVLENCGQVIKRKAVLAFEMGFDQGEALSVEVRKYYPEAEIEVIADLNGLKRMLFVYIDNN